jgi:hypothetical protein
MKTTEREYKFVVSSFPLSDEIFSLFLCSFIVSSHAAKKIFFSIARLSRLKTLYRKLVKLAKPSVIPIDLTVKLDHQ